MENTIQWNVQNWITVLLMAALGMAIVGAVRSFIRVGLPSVNG